MKDNETILAFFGHHKCGTTWIMQIVQCTCLHMGLMHAHFHSPKMWGYDDNSYTLDQVAKNRGLDFVSYISADIGYIGSPENFRGVHVIRDPRDIVTSSYFSHLYSHPTKGWPELVDFRKKLEKSSKDDGFLENMKFTARLPIDGCDINLFSTLMNWNYALPNVMEIKFEELTQDPYRVFLNMFDFLGIIDSRRMTAKSMVNNFLRFRFNKKDSHTLFLKKARNIPAWMLLYYVYDLRFSKLARGRNQGEENIKSHYRKGLPGDWRNHFTEMHKRYFKEHYGEMLVKLGYEKNNDW
jgi:hypothetical protein